MKAKEVSPFAGQVITKMGGVAITYDKRHMMGLLKRRVVESLRIDLWTWW